VRDYILNDALGNQPGVKPGAVLMANLEWLDGEPGRQDIQLFRISCPPRLKGLTFQERDGFSLTKTLPPAKNKQQIRADMESAPAKSAQI
jgi:hypothetical protein